MIPKGNQRGGGQQLAAHLMNSFDNDSVEVASVRGAVAQDLSGAFAEWQAQAKGTRAQKFLYSLSLNPDQRQGKLTREQYYDFIDRTEKSLGLENQPRAVVFHVKHGREHAHVVWSRIDTEKMRAVQLSNDHQKLRKVAQEFAKDHGIELPEGLKENKGADRYEDRKDQAELREKQQEERSGLNKADRVRNITDAWNTTKTPEDFVRALEAKDYILAKGDRRGHVIVDLAGEIHSLNRQIKGAKARAINDRLAGLGPLPSVEQAQERAKQRRETRGRERESSGAADERREALRRQHAARRAVLDEQRDQLALRQAKEKGQLALMQAAEDAGIAAGRADKKPSAIIGFLMRITGIKLITDMRQRAQDRDRARQHREQADALARRQDREQREMQRHFRAMERVEQRELRSLETTLRREEFQRSSGGDSRAPAKLAPQFARAAENNRPDPTLPPPDGTLRDAFVKEGPKPETTIPSTGSLADEFRRRAEQKDRGRDDPDSADTGREKHYRSLPADHTKRR